MHRIVFNKLALQPRRAAMHGLAASAKSLALCLLLALSTSAQAKQPAIVLIIDDLGNDREASLRAVRLQGSITCAVLPHTANATLVATEANTLGKEVIVHAPMSSIDQRATGPGGLHPAQSYGDFASTLQSNIASVPFAIGLNNHMGSQLTQEKDYMSLLMSIIDKHNFYFIDSRTSHKTVAAAMANVHNIRHLSRDIFLDNSQNIKDIHTQFQRLLAIARERGVATAIGHPYPSTLAYLETVLPLLELEEDIRIISGSEAINMLSQEQLRLATISKSIAAPLAEHSP